MKFAISIDNNEISTHFGHAPFFRMITVDPDTKTITHDETVKAPPHQPGLLPRWLAEQKVNVVLTGGMGHRAQELLEENNIKYTLGVVNVNPTVAVEQYLAGTLTVTENACSH